MPTAKPISGQRHNRSHGFTLIEVLVAITVLAIMAIMSWRAIDGMTRAQSASQAYTDAVLTLNAAIAQWKTDLDQQITPLESASSGASSANAEPTPMLWDGQSMRITRRSGGGTEPALQVVAWTRQNNGGNSQWMRWQSQDLRTVGDWRNAWGEAARWAQGGTGTSRNATPLTALTDWQLSYYRGGAWTNALSAGTTQQQTGDEDSGGINLTTQAQGQVDGVRLVLQLPNGAVGSESSAFAGSITVDWVRPTRGGGR